MYDLDDDNLSGPPQDIFFFDRHHCRYSLYDYDDDQDQDQGSPPLPLLNQQDNLLKGTFDPLPENHPLDQLQVDAIDAMLVPNLDPKTCTEEELATNHFCFIEGRAGSGKTLACAYALLRIQSRLRRCNIGADGSKLQRTKASTVYFVASNNQTIFNMYHKLKRLDVDFIVIKTHFESNSDTQMYAGMEDYAISAREAYRRVSDDTLPSIIMITYGQLTHHRTKIAAICKPSLIMIDDASNFFRKSMPDFMKICCNGRLVRTIIVGDNEQLKPFRDYDCPNVASLLNVYPKREVILEGSYRLTPQSYELIRGSSSPTEKHDDTSALKGPYCLFVDCDRLDRNLEGELFPKKARGNDGKSLRPTVTAPALGEQMSELGAAARLARIFTNRGLSFTVLTMYERHREDLSKHCRKLGYSHDFCYNKIYTVDSFQGSEDDYIILLIGCNDRTGFVSDDGRQRAALSRHRKHLTVLSHNEAMESNDMFGRELLSKLYSHKDTKRISGKDLKKWSASTIMHHVCPSL